MTKNTENSEIFAYGVYNNITAVSFIKKYVHSFFESISRPHFVLRVNISNNNTTPYHLYLVFRIFIKYIFVDA